MKTLAAPLRSRVNKLAHALGAEHARQQRQALTGRLLALAAAGAKYRDLDAELARLETPTGAAPSKR